MINISRQAVNKMKKRALAKLQEKLEQSPD